MGSTRTIRLWGPWSLGVALGVFMTIGFALQLWGGPFQKRLPGLQLRQPWAPSPGPAVPSCPPRQRLVFLKTHKSGSSSVLSLLHRYGDRHGLRFALPTRYQFGYPRLFQASWVKGYHPQGGGTQPPFHILCHHMRFNLKEQLWPTLPSPTINPPHRPSARHLPWLLSWTVLEPITGLEPVGTTTHATCYGLTLASLSPQR